MADVKNMNFAISVDDGSRRVPILNMDGEEIGAFRFHPTDIGIIDRYNRMAEQFDAITEPLAACLRISDSSQAVFAEGENCPPNSEGLGRATSEGLNLAEDGSADLVPPEVVNALSEAEKRLYEAVNGLFGSDGAAEAFFGTMHPFSPVNGEFYATQVLQKVGQFIGAQFDTETKAMSKKARKYLK